MRLLWWLTVLVFSWFFGETYVLSPVSLCDVSPIMYGASSEINCTTTDITETALLGVDLLWRVVYLWSRLTTWRTKRNITWGYCRHDSKTRIDLKMTIGICNKIQEKEWSTGESSWRVLGTPCESGVVYGSGGRDPSNTIVQLLVNDFRFIIPVNKINSGHW